MKKAILRIVTLALATLVLSACSTGGSGNTSSQINSESSPVSITLSTNYTTAQIASNASSATFHKMLDRFKEDHPNIKLNVTEMSDADYEKKIQAQAAANDLPDTYGLKGSWTNTFVANNQCAPLDDVLENSGIKDKYRAGIFSPVTIDGKIYGMPTQYTVTSIVFYNSDLWKSIGYESFPDNWNDIIAAAPKFKDKGIIPIVLGDQDGWEYESCILSALGDRFTGTEWTNNIIANNGKSKFTDEDFVKALEFTQTLINAELFNPDVTSIDNAQAEALYASGKAATTIDGYWNVTTVEKTATEDVLDATHLAILPPVDGGKGVANATSGGPGWFLAVNGGIEGDKLAAAKEFVGYMTGEEYSKVIAADFGVVGAVNIGEVDLSKFSHLTQEYMGLINSDITMTPVYDIQMDGAVIDVMNTGVQSMFVNAITPAELAAQIQAAQDGLSK